MAYALLYDGDCIFCQEQSLRLLRMAAPGSIERFDFHADGILERFPGVTYERCMREMVLVTDKGAYGGMDAVFRSLATRPGLAWLVPLYHVPGLKQLFDLGYRLIAKYRYFLMGKRIAAGECDGGSCSLRA